MPQTLTSFHVKHNIETKIQSVWLAEDANKYNLQIFYCHRCRYPILQYKGSVVTLLPGSSESKLPIVVQCKGKNCGCKYHFHMILKKDM